MRLESARELKGELMDRFVVPLAAAANVRVRAAAGPASHTLRSGGLPWPDIELAAAVSAEDMSELPTLQRSIALGVAPSPRGEYRLAIRVQRASLLHSAQVEAMRRQAHGEVDVRFVGRLRKRLAAQGGRVPVSWFRDDRRPLQPGLSIGHVDITAGTLGCFVRKKGKRIYILSNNHVLANEDAGVAGDFILQPGRLDGGRKRNRVGELAPGWVKLKQKSENLVDCALATLDDDVAHDPAPLRGLGAKRSARLAGLSPEGWLDAGLKVYKVGRTTGATSGRVTAIEVDNVVVGFAMGNLRFDGQIEIEGTGKRPFSDGGDSGSLIVDDEFRGLGLLFAGGESGGANGLGLTYANPLRTVLANLKATLLY